eukprot:m.194954 g.194954  ORF g.194954 m.194954 type:complete len:1783 (+) comp39514_c0_seq3:1043-6391(+)
MRSISFRQNNKGAHPSWHLEKATVFDVARSKKTCFDCDRWLDSESGLSATLFPERSPDSRRKSRLELGKREPETPERKIHRRKSAKLKQNKCKDAPSLPLYVPSSLSSQLTRRKSRRESPPSDEPNTSESKHAGERNSLTRRGNSLRSRASVDFQRTDLSDSVSFASSSAALEEADGVRIKAEDCTKCDSKEGDLGNSSKSGDLSGSVKDSESLSPALPADNVGELDAAKSAVRSGNDADEQKSESENACTSECLPHTKQEEARQSEETPENAIIVSIEIPNSEDDESLKNGQTTASPKDLQEKLAEPLHDQRRFVPIKEDAEESETSSKKPEDHPSPTSDAREEPKENLSQSSEPRRESEEQTKVKSPEVKSPEEENPLLSPSSLSDDVLLIEDQTNIVNGIDGSSRTPSTNEVLERPPNPISGVRQGRFSSVTSSLSDSVPPSPVSSPLAIQAKEVSSESDSDEASSISSANSELRALQSRTDSQGSQKEDLEKHTYEIAVFTSDLSNAGTKANIFLELFGPGGEKSGKLAMKAEGKQFKRDSAIHCYVETRIIGDFIEKVRIWHDNSGFAPGWHLAKLEIARVVSRSVSEDVGVSTPHLVHEGKVVTFPCDQWLSRSEMDGEITRDLLPLALDRKGTLKVKKYGVLVFTGDVRFAGTDADVYMTIFGTRGDSGERQLRSSSRLKNKFERNDVDVFSVEVADLGILERIRVRVDEKYLGTEYYLEKVVISDLEDGLSTSFLCRDWLARNRDENASAEKEFVAEKVKMPQRSRSPSLLAHEPNATSYRISVNTGDVFRAGTDAHVFVVLFGEENSSEVLHVTQSLCSGNKFDRNKTDIFVFEISTGLGHLKSVKVWHDNKGFGAAWFLDSIQVCDESTGRVYDFPCHSWLARDKGDGKTVRELKCQAVRADLEEERDESDVTLRPALPGRSKVQRLRERWYLSMFQMADQSKKKFVSETDLVKICKKLNVGMSNAAIKEKFKEIVGKGKNETMDYDQFKKYFKELLYRPEVFLLFARYSSNREYMSVENLKKFLVSEQAVVEVKDQYCSDVIEDFGELEDPQSESSTRRLTFDGFTQYLLSADNSIFNGVHSAVHQDMSHPLNHYFIATSHNTYLIEDQLRGQSSEEGYIRALRKGCRCVEIDCWDGEDGEPEVYHGYTLTSRISLKSVFEAIDRHAFDVSQFPVILSFENHCSIKGQQRMAELLEEVFGEKLYTDPVDRKRRHLPSPDELCGRIIIKNKKLLTDETISNYGSDTDEDVDSDYEETMSVGESSLKSPNSSSTISLRVSTERKAKKEKHPIALELSRLVNIVQAVKFKDLSKGDFWKMSSLGESKLFKLIGSSAGQLVEYNRHQMMRVYPAGRRVDSSNYNPVDPWTCGCSMVALNYQFAGKMMDLNTGNFLQNGGSGYVLKPLVLREGDNSFSPFLEGPVPSTTPKLFTIKVISGQQFPKPSLSSSEKDTVDPSVIVEICGAPQDRREVRTKAVSGNGFNPVWDEKFSFPIHWPELALARFLVVSGKGTGNVIGQYTLPINSVLQGYRHVPLLSFAGHLQPYATLFVHVSFGRLLKRSPSSASSLQRSRTSSSLGRSSTKMWKKQSKSRDYTKMKRIGVKQMDDIFEPADYLLVQASDLAAEVEENFSFLRERTESTDDYRFFSTVKAILATHDLLIDIEDDMPVLTSSKDSIPVEIAQLTVIFHHVVSAGKALINQGEQIAEEIMRIHENGSKLTISIELKNAGLKEKTISKAIECFAWNMQILKDSASVLKVEREKWEKEMEMLESLQL